MCVRLLKYKKWTRSIVSLAARIIGLAVSWNGTLVIL